MNRNEILVTSIIYFVTDLAFSSNWYYLVYIKIGP